MRDGTFWQHTAELIARLRIMIYAVMISSITVMIVPIDLESIRLSFTSPMYQTVATYVINKMREDFLPEGVQLLPLDWFAPFTIYIYVSIFLGLILSSPIIMYEIYKFINPALFEHERRYVLLFASFFALLFTVGVVFGYVLIVPITFRMLLVSTLLLGLTPSYEFTSFFSLILGGLVTSGLMFTFPVLFVTLVKAGILETSYVTRSRKFLYGGLFIAICLLTPDPTVVTDILIFIPLVTLSELGIFIGKRVEKARKALGPIGSRTPKG